MIVKVSDIEDTVILKGMIEGDTPQSHEERGFAFAAPILYNLTITRFDRSLRVMGTVESSLLMTCGRCLEEFEYHVKSRIDIGLEPEALLPSGEVEIELKRDDLDIHFYKGDEVDLDLLVHEEVLLNIPISPICDVDCKGLCEVCGRNRNKEVCDCNTRSTSLLAERLTAFLTYQGDNYGRSKEKDLSVKKRQKKDTLQG